MNTKERKSLKLVNDDDETTSRQSKLKLHSNLPLNQISLSPFSFSLLISHTIEATKHGICCFFSITLKTLNLDRSSTKHV